uniref:Clc-like protein n=1 Tax=Rhabditophanes sp. KR3021 TaxID=114890 RepID=A0AC35U4Q8_9BILA
MSSTGDYGIKISLIVAASLTAIGMGLSMTAIFMSSWQIVNLREYNSIHEHGLWLDCTRHSRDGNVLLRRYATISEPLHCVYKFDYDKYSGTFDIEDDNSPVGEVNRHKFYGWHTATLIMLFVALLTASLSIFIGLCACCYKTLALIYTSIAVLTCFISAIAEGLFFFYSHRADNRFIKGIVGTYEQKVGPAFFFQLAACFAHFFAVLVAMIFTYFSLSGKSDPSDLFSVNRSSRTNVTNIGRSMEFEPQLYNYQQNANSNLRPVTYHTKNDEFERTVAESMPELVNRPYGGELLQPRIRRKSETCV